MQLQHLPHAWSELSWQQLTGCWRVKQRYGGNADVARVAALLMLMGVKTEHCKAPVYDIATGEPLYTLSDKDGCWHITPRELSQMAKGVLTWFDYPYGDPGEAPVKDKKGKVIKEGRNPVRGYVSGMRDAMILPKDDIKVSFKVFALPQVACNNLTWQQYRSLQAIAPQLFSDDMDEETILDLQAQFLAHCLVPRSLALLDTTSGSVRFRPHHEFVYNANQADTLVKFWRSRLHSGDALCIFHICFQVYQTALSYYSSVYPLLFSGEDKKDAMRDALSGEVGTINTVMKYAGYAEQQQVYDSNLPFVLDILNTMTKEAKEIERMNARAKKK